MGERVAGGGVAEAAPVEAIEPPPDFDEDAYAVAFPDVAESVRAGRIKSLLEHYTRHGVNEQRLLKPRYQIALLAQRQLRDLSSSSAAPPQADRPVASGLDTVLVAEGDFCLIIGWIDDRSAPLRGISLEMPGGRVITSTAIARCRRPDAEASTGCPAGHLLGFWTLVPATLAEATAQDVTVAMMFGSSKVTHAAHPRLMTGAGLREAIFEYIASATYYGTPAVESFQQFESGIGRALLNMNRIVSDQFASQPYIERLGPAGRKFRASIVVCLYGRPEYLFLQAALFAAAPDAQAYEFIFVCNSPELTEPLQREARIAARLYGLSLTMVYLPGNAGFGAANNAAVKVAASKRILIVNPDVFPRQDNWAERHAQIVESLPASQTALFGVPLFYDDGSLMHGGMYFEVDGGLSVKATSIVRQDLLRVEHYGKGAPPDTALYRASRRVPAVTGAFMSADRAWFEKLGGFSEEFAFGHYEDADLCLKSWKAGREVWLHNLPFWHLEGKGSVRRHAHEGGTMVNRWHFTKTWLRTVQHEFLGTDPLRLRA